MTPQGDPLSNHLATLIAELLSAPGCHGLDWPSTSMSVLAAHRVPGWCLAAEWGGSSISDAEMLRRYRLLAEADLASAFILTQRNGAATRIAESSADRVKQDWLPAIASGEKLATVGISHLSTSRQHWSKPTVAAEITPTGIQLDGEIPWVTAADRCDLIVTGGLLPDGRQILMAVPTTTPGVSPGPLLPLLALSCTHTTTVRLSNVHVSHDHVLVPPTERVLRQGALASAGSTSTSALAIGLSDAAISLLRDLAIERPVLQPVVSAFETESASLWSNLMSAVRGSTAETPHTGAEQLRTRANMLVLRSTQTALAASKGAGFIADHPASRAAAAAMFFLVWSCPQPVLTATMQSLAIPFQLSAGPEC